MKRGILFIAFFFCIFLIFAQNPQVIVKEINGTVELLKPGTSSWVPAKTGDRLTKATVISTGFKSMALLVIGETSLVVRPLTRLSLEELLSQNETETINVGLKTGRVQVNVNPPAGTKANFTVQTPTATASVRGTSFKIDPMRIRVNKGSVKYEASASITGAYSVKVKAGQSTWINAELGIPMNPVNVAEHSRQLPPLAGEASGSGGDGSRLEIPRGSFEIEIGLESSN